MAAILARSGNLNAGNLGDFRSTIEGAVANLGVDDTDARLRNAAAGAGNPFSETEVKAQEFVNLPAATRANVASAVPTDQVFGGALAATQTPQQLAALGVQKAQPSSITEFLFAQQNPEFENFARSTSGGINLAVGEDGTVSVPLSKTNTSNTQRNIVSKDKAANLSDQLSGLLSTNNTGAIPTLLDRPEVGIANQLIPGAVDSAIQLLPGEQDFNQLKIDRSEAERIINQIREQLVNEQGKLSDKDQERVEKLGTALRADITAEQAKIIVDNFTAELRREVENDKRLLREGLDISPGQPSITEQDIDNMTEEELDRFLAQ